MEANIYRTHHCGQLRMSDVGKDVTLSGWVNSIRKLGGITFATLRDNYGITQILVRDESKMENICKETVIKVTGKVVERESKNPKMPTGDIEILADEIEILGKCAPVLPFEIADSNSTKEELRLKYRYLDLRNPEVHENILLRSKVMSFVRNKMIELGFNEFHTPILTSSSPEGARDFLVPSRLNPGKFYALPQSPQQFKQLLMIAGFDKYFQIAPCFRDEDARADRSPGEFYQVDLEMSFATQEDVFKVMEDVLYSTFKEFAPDKEITPPPFERINYKDSMEKYCSDKPDLRNPLTVQDATELFSQTTITPLIEKSIKMIICETGDKPRSFYDNLNKFVQSYEGKGLFWLKRNEAGELSGSIAKGLNDKEKNFFDQNLKVGASAFILADTKTNVIKLMGILRNKLGEELNLINKNKFHFCWVVNFPFFEEGEEEGSIAFSHNPFSMPQGGLDALLNQNPFDILAYQYDVVLNGVEMASGAVRNHNPEIMVKAFEMAGYNKSVVESKFPALFNAFFYGAPPHAGAAFGFDRVVMFLAGTEMIRDVIAFPFNKNAQDLLMSAPNEVSEEQLKDVSIKLDLK
ncbi:MAG: aspartate--tRNA ligase [Eubacteriales bacterium]|nr:aspartate--tRNA ligase [Eubacteriales bacterium]